MSSLAARFVPFLRPIGGVAAAVGLGLLLLSLGDAHRPSVAQVDQSSAIPSLDAACRETAAWLSRQLPFECQTIVQPPFIVAGNAEQGQLQLWCDTLVAPAVDALRVQYFDACEPREPVTLLLLSDETTYRRCAETLFGRAPVSSFGFYQPHLRIVAVNLARGPSGLKHELTHALMAFDFPHAPDWFCEGLACLHEDSRIRADGAGLEGLVNWRLPLLRQSLDRGDLPPLADLLGGNDFHGRHQRRSYAHARYFCMWLHDRGVLEDFYRRFRQHACDDPHGLAAAVALLSPCGTPADVDADFRLWLRRLCADNA